MNPPPQQAPSAPLPQPLPLPATDLARAATENILLANCGYCHGPALTPAQAQGGINYINDIDKLVEAGFLLPLNSADSLIIVLMRNGIEPPPSSGYPRVSDAEIEIVAQYIDNPRFWADVAPPVAVDAGAGVPVVVDAGADGG